VAWGATQQDALEKGREAAIRWVARAPEFGITVPEPGAKAPATGVVRLRVPRSLHARLAVLATRLGISLNAVVNKLAEAALEGRVADLEKASPGCGIQQLAARALPRTEADSHQPPRQYSGVWIQRMAPGVHHAVQRLAEHDGVSGNLWLAIVLAEQTGRIEMMLDQ
jgi:predicted HicB family RNase H-like nuclease